MISFISGRVEVITDKYLIIDTGGIGFKVFVPSYILQKVSRNIQIKLCTYMDVGENVFSLYGFENYEDVDMFQKLLQVSGVGTKVAFNILSYTDSSKLKLAILKEDLSFFKNISGVGKKIAQRIIFELKDKFLQEETLPREDEKDAEIWQEAISALTSLSYTQKEIYEAINFAKENLKSATLQEIIKTSLSYLGKKKL